MAVIDMNRTRVALGLAVVQAMSLTGGSCALAAGRQSRGYSLIQKSLYAGRASVKLSTEGTKIETSEYSIFVQPSGNVRLYSRTNHTFCELPRKYWTDKYSIDSNYRVVKKGKTFQRMGHTVTEYFAICYSQGPNPTPVRYMQFYASRDFKLPAAIQNDYLTLLGLPSGYGMPLWVIRRSRDSRSPDGAPNTVVDTLDIRPATFAADEFTPPSGYTRVKDEMDVIVGVGRDSIDSLLDDSSSGQKHAAIRR